MLASLLRYPSHVTISHIASTINAIALTSPETARIIDSLPTPFTDGWTTNATSSTFLNKF